MCVSVLVSTFVTCAELLSSPRVHPRSDPVGGASRARKRASAALRTASRKDAFSQSLTSTPSTSGAWQASALLQSSHAALRQAQSFSTAWSHLGLHESTCSVIVLGRPMHPLSCISLAEPHAAPGVRNSYLKSSRGHHQSEAGGSVAQAIRRATTSASACTLLHGERCVAMRRTSKSCCREQAAHPVQSL